jgi:5'-nucleotidase / UDP-sugar diphosphatase
MRARIAFTNDLHSHVLEAAGLFAALLREREAGALVVDAGDFFEGAPFYELFGGAPEQEIAERVYDVMAPGNHGFGHYVSVRGPRVLNANVVRDGKALFSTHHIVRLGGLRVALVGILSLEAFSAVERDLRAGCEAREPADVLRDLVPALRAQADAVVLVSHGGIEHDRELCRRIPPVDAVIAAHCHTASYQERVGTTVICKAPELGAGMGILELDRVGGAHFEIRRSPRGGGDALDFLKDFEVRYHEVMDDEVVRGDERLTRIVPDRRAVTRALARWCTRSCRCDGAVLNLTGFRDGFRSHRVTREDVYRVAPFDNRLVRIRIDRGNAMEVIRRSPPALELVQDWREVAAGREESAVVTTSYLAENVFDARRAGAVVPLMHVREALVSMVQELCAE